MLVPGWRKSAASRTSNTASENSVQKLRAARPGTFIKEGRPQARAAGVAHRGDSRFRVGKFNWRFAPTKCKIFLGIEIWQGAGFRKHRKTLCFQPFKFKFKKEITLSVHC